MGYNQIMVAQAVSQLARMLGIDKQIAKTKMFDSGEYALPFTDGLTTLSGNLQFKDAVAYHVKWDETEYVCKAYTHKLDGTRAVLVGNSAIYGNPNTGEPFLIVAT